MVNTFWIDSNLKKAAQSHVKKHVGKMIVEMVQMLSTAQWLQNTNKRANRLYREGRIYKISHRQHPMCKWTREHYNNYETMCLFAIELGKEFEFRRGKKHKTALYLNWLLENPPLYIPICQDSYKLVQPFNTTKIPRCFGESFDKHNVDGDIVQSYRNLYKHEKAHLHDWEMRPKPKWI